MPLQNFVDKIGPVISAAWANGVDVLKVTIFGDAATPAQARTNLTLDAPLEIVNGGTGQRTPILSQNSIGGALWPRSTIEGFAGVTPTNYGYEYGDIRRYGAVVGTDCTSAIQQALTVASYGQEVIVPEGIWQVMSVASTGNNEHSLTVTNGTRVRGAGKDVSQFQMIGTNPGHMFYAANSYNVEFRDVGFYGNSQATGYGMGAAIYFNNTSAGASVMGNYLIENCRFDNFKGPYWISIIANTAVYDTRRVRIKGCDFYSYSGNAISLLITYVANCILLEGSTYSGSGSNETYITDVEVSDCVAENTYIKAFFSIYGSVKRLKVHHNIVKNVAMDSSFTPPAWNSGTTYTYNTPTNSSCTYGGVQYYAIATSTNIAPPNGAYWAVFNGTGGYAFNLYHSSGTTTTYMNSRLECSDNVIEGAADCGFYFAATNDAQVNDNIISGVIGTLEGTIPKGAIVIEGVYQGTVSGNYIDGCCRGIVITGNPNGGRYAVTSNTITNITNGVHGNSSGIRLSITVFQPWSSTAAYTPGVIVSNGGNSYYCILANKNIAPPNITYWLGAQSSPTVQQWDTCVIVGNTIQGFDTTAIGIDIQGSPSYGGKTLVIEGNDINCYNYGVFYDPAYFAASDLAYGTIITKNNMIRTNNANGFYMGSVNTATTVVSSNTFDTGIYWNNGGAHFYSAANAGNIDLSDNMFLNWTGGAGFAVYGPDPVRSVNVKGNHFKNTPHTNLFYIGGTINIGQNINLTGLTPAQGDYWQVFAPYEVTDGGTAGFGNPGQKYCIYGWLWDFNSGGAWKADRHLTGN